ncbi:CFF_collapsed_G0044870.mRNA.1.CDS.1 [Saccharomyces cerevisiae]|nr:CFF_collapsed_G0044870.mRNA.1.CDS.1 [Saccharomyces cerevisiae]
MFQKIISNVIFSLLTGILLKFTKRLELQKKRSLQMFLGAVAFTPGAYNWEGVLTEGWAFNIFRSPR